MADLSTLDSTQPPDGQAVSQGAARIRETRDATKTSVAVEHTLAGQHTFPRGALGAEPAAGNAGRIYLNTTLGLLERDTGTVWQVLHALSANSSFLAGANPVTLTTVYQVVRSIVFSSPADGSCIAYGQFQVGLRAGTWSCKLQLDAVDLQGPLDVTNTNTGHIFQFPIIAIPGGMAVGSHTLTLLAKVDTLTDTINNTFLAALVF